MNNDNKNIVIIGGSGLIGRHLVKLLRSNGYSPIVLSRNPLKVKTLFSSDIEIQKWDGKDTEQLSKLIDGKKGIINLAGETIATRWTKKKKELIVSSRIETTKIISTAINNCKNPPEIFIQGSAIGYYHYNSNDQVDENSGQGSGFLSNLVSHWENAAKQIESKTRLVIVRTGIVFSKDGGFLSKIIPSIKFFAGGWFGNGNQFLSWIHIDDYSKAILFLLEKNDSHGVYNLVSPNPITYKALVRKIGSKLHRPIWMPVPSFILRLGFGSMADEVLLSNQNVIPKRLVDQGFSFNYNQIDSALDDLI
ncbi:MAG: TIGR01777 family oxidoreductase [Tenuifilaceae bacterium]